MSKFFYGCQAINSIRGIVALNIPKVSLSQYEKHTGAFEYTIIYNNELKKICHQSNLFLVDAYRLFNTDDLESLVCSDGIHPSKTGNLLLAEGIAKSLTAIELSHKIQDIKNRTELEDLLPVLDDLGPIDTRLLDPIYASLHKFDFHREICDLYLKQRLNPQSAIKIVQTSAQSLGRISLYNTLALNTNTPITLTDQYLSLEKLPSTFVLELTNMCNLRCPFCSHSYMQERKQGFMSDEVFNRVLKQIKEKAVQVRVYSTGESLLHPKVLEYIKLLQDDGIRVLLNTNGTLVNDNFLQKMSLLNATPELMQLSLEGWNRETYEYFRKGANFAKTRENLALLKEYRDGLHWNMRLVAHGLVTHKTDCAEFRRIWGPYFDEVNFGIMMPPRFFNEKAPDNLMKDLFKVPSRSKPSLCYLPFTELTIGWDGEVSACCGDFDFRTRMGNILTEDILSIWHSEQYDKLRYDLWSGNLEKSICQGCDFPFYLNNPEVNKFLATKSKAE